MFEPGEGINYRLPWARARRRGEIIEAREEMFVLCSQIVLLFGIFDYVAEEQTISLLGQVGYSFVFCFFNFLLLLCDLLTSYTQLKVTKLNNNTTGLP